MSKVLIGSVRGPAGPVGPAGPAGPAGPNTVPTQQAIADAVIQDGPAKEALSAAFARGVSVVEFGAVGGNPAVDTAAFQAALSASRGPVYVPPAPSGTRYQINASLTMPKTGTSRSVIGLGNGMVEIEFTGTGYLFEAESTNPALTTEAPIDVYFCNLRIDGYNNTISDGGINVDGGYFVNFDRVEVRRFAKAGAVGVRLHNSFSIDFARSNVLSITNGVGLQIGGSLQQVTNVHVHDFVLQRSGVNFEVTTGITGGGLQLDNGAIRANDAQIAVRVTGKYADLRFGPALHIESETVVGSNTTRGFVFSGATLYTSAVKFEGIDFYNIKTLFDLDGSAGTLRDVEINHIVATALAGLAGTAFKLNTVTPGFRLGRYQIASTEYTTIFNVTATDIAESVFVPAAELVGVLGSPNIGSLNRWPAWMLDAASSEILGWASRIPRDWNNLAIDVVWANAGAGSGDVVLRADVGFRTLGQTAATPGAGTPATVTAGAVNVITTTQLVATVGVTASAFAVVDLVRVGGDAADTLGNDIAVLGLILRRVG